MPKYTIHGTSVLHNDTLYEEGSTIELTKEEAQPLAAVLTEIKATSAKKDPDPKPTASGKEGSFTPPTGDAGGDSNTNLTGTN
ncbi:MAG: hypothetical protein JSS89_13275 [Bacteroidetes bacterium]|nr:hypothetical protein [Bacteroidota bacterium]